MMAATIDHTELQARLLRAAAADPQCLRISEWVVQAIRPASGGRRTDVMLVGFCGEHYRDGDLVDVLGEMGYREGVAVAWEGLGALLDGMRQSGLLAS